MFPIIINPSAPALRSAARTLEEAANILSMQVVERVEVAHPRRHGPAAAVILGDLGFGQDGCWLGHGGRSGAGQPGWPDGPSHLDDPNQKLNRRSDRPYLTNPIITLANFLHQLWKILLHPARRLVIVR